MASDRLPTIVKTNIGNLAIFWLSMRNRIDVEKELGSDLKKIDSKVYIKTIIKFICHKESYLSDLQTKPKEITLKGNEIDALTDDDLETIAKEYITANDYLYKKHITETNENEDGVNVISSMYGDVEFPKYDTESYVDYLLRLEVEQNEKIREAVKSIIEPLSSFSKSIQDSFKGTVSLGENLRNTINTLQSIKIPHISPVIPQIPKLDLKKTTDQISNFEERPMLEVAYGIEELVEINSQSIKFMIQANELQAQIAEEIKRSSDSSTKLTKWNIVLSVLVLIISFTALGFSFMSDKQTNKWNSTRVDTIVSSLEKINESVMRNKDNSQPQINDIKKLQMQMDSLKIRIKELQHEILITKAQNINAP